MVQKNLLDACDLSIRLSRNILLRDGSEYHNALTNTSYHLGDIA